MGMETNVNALFANYGEVGFVSIVDTKLAPLMLLGDCGRPNIGFGFQDGLSFYFGCLGFGLGYAQDKNGGNYWLIEGKLCWFYGNVWYFFRDSTVHTPHSLFCLVVCRCQR